MKKIVLLFTILGSIQCQLQSPFGFGSSPTTEPRISQFNLKNSLRGFMFYVDTGDFHHEAIGELVSGQGTGKEEEDLEVAGFYQYRGPDGNTYRVDYTAGKRGFRPVGVHLPPSADVRNFALGLSPSAQASLIGGGLG